jgi:hypothetical protein
MSEAGDVLPDWDAWSADAHDDEWIAAEEIEADERARAMATATPEPEPEPARSNVCVICHFETEQDDIQVRGTRGVVCVRCYEREVGAEKPMPPTLRREIQSIVKDVK